MLDALERVGAGQNAGGADVYLAKLVDGFSGDFNNDGTVDASDYVVWRNGLGTIYTQNDYNVWRARFGQTAGSGSALPSAGPLPSAVPEPATFALLFAAVGPVGLILWTRRMGSHTGRASGTPARNGYDLAGLEVRRR